MYNYNRDVYQAEQERMMRMMIAGQRQVPYHLRSNGFKQMTGWMSANLGAPFSEVWSGIYGVVSHRVFILYRRGSTRIAGLLLNALEGLFDLAPGRS
jgi:hypothetical protein